MNILVISDDENSSLIQRLNRKNVVTIIRKSILAAIDFLRHQEIYAIIIDKEHQDVDTLEFILNVQDFNQKIPIYVPQQFLDKENWAAIKNMGRVLSLNDDLGQFNLTEKSN